MIILRLVLKIWSRFFQPSQGLPTGIDSHKWESKIEVYRLLSREPH